ncbi:hypothetical protein, partial [Dialister succinatiphilus]|uniref:hypothetical protein n=1 Tax=Dialister succinatiphilus TaxID=487173 RepID=UPI0040276413
MSIDFSAVSCNVISLSSFLLFFTLQNKEKPPTEEGGFSYPFIIYFYGANAILGTEWKPLMNFTHLSRVSKAKGREKHFPGAYRRTTSSPMMALYEPAGQTVCIQPDFLMRTPGNDQSAFRSSSRSHIDNV